jgi:DNA-binding NarL/FixJ family response regulator
MVIPDVMKILITDDHPVLRAGLAALLRQVIPDIAILEAGSGKEALEIAEGVSDLDIVVLDLVMPGMGGMEALAEFGRRHPGTPRIILSSSEEPEEAREALEAGAQAYVPKSAGPQTVVYAIEAVMRGETYVPPLLLSLLGLKQRADAAAGSAPAVRLTERQIDILRLLSAGRPNKTIAYELDCSEKTVKAHITSIFKALNVVNRTQAAAAARQAGLI